MIAFEISERRELDGAITPGLRDIATRRSGGLSGRAQFIGDILNQTSHERELAAGILQQAKADLWRFRKSKDKAGREVYSDALSWFLSNDAEWACSFQNVCRFLGLSPEELREQYSPMRTPAGLPIPAVLPQPPQHKGGLASRLSFLSRRSSALALPQL